MSLNTELVAITIMKRSITNIDFHFLLSNSNLQICEECETYDSNYPANARNEFLLNSISVCFSGIIKMHARNVADYHERNSIPAMRHAYR